MTFLLVLSLTNIHALEAQSISKPLVYDELTETQQIIWNYYESIAARDWEIRQALLYLPIR